MSDPSVLLKNLFGSGAPSENEFKYSIVRPSIINTVIHYLGLYNSCIIVGRPRSGKTTLAQYVGWEVLQGRYEKLENVRYLDCANIIDVVDQYPYIPAACFNNKWLIIIDNWHARPECQAQLDRLIKSHTGSNFTLLYCLTRFESVDATTAMPDLSQYCDDDSPVVDTSSSTAEVAQNMIRYHYNSHLKKATMQDPTTRLQVTREPHTPYSLDLEDYAQALTASSAHKKIRGNLRFLHWRLSAWNPSLQPFKDVKIDDVLVTFKRDVIQPSVSHIGTLEQIAAVSQWELPFTRSPGDALPDGILELERLGVTIPISHGTSWRMDSTDAYMLLLSRYGEQWQSVTARLMVNYAVSHPGVALTFMNTLIAQAHAGPMNDLAAAMLSNIGSRMEVQSALISGVKGGSIGYKRLYRIIYTLARNIPSDIELAKQRLAHIHDILPESLGHTFGLMTKGKSANTIMWFLILLDKYPDTFKEFVLAFLNGYGHENLHHKIDNLQSGRSQRTLLRSINVFNHDLYSLIHDSTTLKPIKRKRNSDDLEHLANELYRGMQMMHDDRRKCIDALYTIDESYLLDTIDRCRNPISSLQKLMHVAMWLSPDESRRLASILPSVFPHIGTKGDASCWSYLINNTYAASPSIAEDLVDIVCSNPVNQFIMDEPYACSRLLCAMEKTQPGRIAGWIASDEACLRKALSCDYLSQHKSPSHVEDIILTLAAFAAPSLAKLHADSSLHDSILKTKSASSLESYIIRGSFRIAGIDSGQYGGGIDKRLINRLSPAIQILIGLFDLNQEYCNGNSCNYLDICTNTESLPSPTILGIARLTRRWDAYDVLAATRTILRGNKPDRIKMLESIILSAHMLEILELPNDDDAITSPRGMCGLKTAVHEKILLTHYNKKASRYEAILNADHPLVQTTIFSIEAVLGATDNTHKTLSEWMIGIPHSMPAMELNTWRSRLINCGVVLPIITARNESLNITFTRSKVIRENMYASIHKRSSV